MELDVTLEMVPNRAMRHDEGIARLCLLFRRGERPDAAGVVQLIERARESGLPAIVSHQPDGDANWLELLASGLTFDLSGLAPGTPGVPIDGQYHFGFQNDQPLAEYEVVELFPSGHIVAGAGLQPVLRTMMGLAANLALELPVQAVGWGPAQTVMEPRYFCRSVLNWLGGGAFPSLGLTALVSAKDGSIFSRGLAYFIGQDMQLEGKRGESPADAAKLAVRVIDHLVRHGRVVEPLRIDAGTQVLLAEPSQIGKLVLVWREDRD